MADEAEVVLDDKLCSELIALTMENLRHANLNNVQVEAVLINCLVGLYMTLSPHLHRPQVEFMANKVLEVLEMNCLFNSVEPSGKPN